MRPLKLLLRRKELATARLEVVVTLSTETTLERWVNESEGEGDRLISGGRLDKGMIGGEMKTRPGF